MSTPTLTLKPDPIPESLHLDALRYNGETRKVQEILKDQEAVKLIESVRGQVKSDARRVFMLSAIRITPSMCPRVFEVINTVISTLRLEAEPEIYVRQSPELNAGCASGSASLSEAKPILVLTSGLIEKMTPDELLFVLGHEMGHWIFKHHEYAVPNIMQFPQAGRNPYQSMQVMSLSRAQEISSDRIGLLCCQNFTTAVRTFFKLASGLSNEYIEPDLKEYWQQVLEAGELETTAEDDLGWFASHPFNPYRLKALYHYWSWDTVQPIWKGPKPVKSLDREKVEKLTDEILKDMDPDYIRAEHVALFKITEFMAWAGALVMGADGKVDPREIAKINAFVGDKLTNEVTRKVQSKFDPQELYKKCADLSVPLRGKTTRVARTQLISNLLMIALSDRNVDERELNVIATLCQMMEVDPSIIPSLVQKVSGGRLTVRRQVRRF